MPAFSASTPHLRGYPQVDAWRAQASWLCRMDARASTLDVFGCLGPLRAGIVIGGGAPQFGLRRPGYASVTKNFWARRRRWQTTRLGIRLAAVVRHGSPQEVAARTTCGDMGSPAHRGAALMNPLAANRTAARCLPLSQGHSYHGAFVEDLNWPGTRASPDSKRQRRTAMWMPGPNGQWEDVPPTLQ